MESNKFSKKFGKLNGVVDVIKFFTDNPLKDFTSPQLLRLRDTVRKFNVQNDLSHLLTMLDVEIESRNKINQSKENILMKIIFLLVNLFIKKS